MNDAFSRRGFSQVLGLGLLGAGLPLSASADVGSLHARFEQVELVPGGRTSESEAVNPNVAVALFLRHDQAATVVLPSYAVKLRATGSGRGTFFPVRTGLMTRRGPLRHVSLLAGRESIYCTFHGRLTRNAGAWRLVASARNADAVAERDREGLAALSGVSGDVTLRFSSAWRSSRGSRSR